MGHPWDKWSALYMYGILHMPIRMCMGQNTHMVHITHKNLCEDLRFNDGIYCIYLAPHIRNSLVSLTLHFHSVVFEGRERSKSSTLKEMMMLISILESILRCPLRHTVYKNGALISYWLYRSLLLVSMLPCNNYHHLSTTTMHSVIQNSSQQCYRAYTAMM